FNGKEMDISTGLFHYGARHYDPRLGLWMSPDPILAKYMQTGDGLGVHSPRNLWLYSMTGNNPVNFIDRDGKCYDAASCQAELYGPQLPAEYVEARNEGRLQLIKGAWNALVRSVVGGPAIVPYAPPQEQQRAVEQAETREDAAIDAVGAKDVSPGAEVAGAALLAVASVGSGGRGVPKAAARGVRVPFKGFQEWGRPLWGRNVEGAQKAVESMTPEVAKTIDPEKARQALEFYRQAADGGRGGETAR